MSWFKGIVDKVRTVSGPRGEAGDQLGASASSAEQPDAKRRSQRGISDGHGLSAASAAIAADRDWRQQRDVLRLNDMWIKYHGRGGSEQEEAQLTGILDLFVRVFADSSPSNIRDAFHDVDRLTSVLARLLVTQCRSLRMSAADLSTLGVSVAVWAAAEATALLRVLQLVLPIESCSKVAAQCSLPSTLVDVLHDIRTILPEAAVAHAAEHDHDVTIVPTTVSALPALLGHCLSSMVKVPVARDELIHSHTLLVLCNLCCATDAPAVADIPLQACRVIQSLAPPDRTALAAIESEGCFVALLNGLRNHADLAAAQVLAVAQAVLAMVAAAQSVSRTALLSDLIAIAVPSFRTVLLAFEQDPAAHALLPDLLAVMQDLSFLGPDPVQAAIVEQSGVDAAELTRLFKDSPGEWTVRCPIILATVRDAFVQRAGHDSVLEQAVIDMMFRVYSMSLVNYYLLKPQGVLATFVAALDQVSVPAKELILKLVECVITVTNGVPEPELQTMCKLLAPTEEPHVSSTDSSAAALIRPPLQASTAELVFATVRKLLSFDEQYCIVFRSVGLLSVLLRWLALFADPAVVLSASDPAPLAWYKQVMVCIAALITGDSECVSVVRTSGTPNVLRVLLGRVSLRASALHVLQSLFLSVDPATDTFPELDGILETMHMAPRDDLAMKTDILGLLRRVLASPSAAAVRPRFREAGGFTSVLSLVAMLERQDSRQDLPHRMALLRAVFAVTIAAVAGDTRNRVYVSDDVGYRVIANSIVLSGLLAVGEAHAWLVLRLMIDLALERCDRSLDIEAPSALQPTAEDAAATATTAGLLDGVDVTLAVIKNPEAILSIVYLLRKADLPVAMHVRSLTDLAQIAGNGCVDNIRELGLAEVVHAVLRQYESDIVDPSSTLHAPVMSLLASICPMHVSERELRGLWRLACGLRLSAVGSAAATAAAVALETDDYVASAEQALQLRPHLIDAMAGWAELGRHPPFIEFDARALGYGCVTVPSFGERSWPPAVGYSLSTWLWMDALPEAGDASDDAAADKLLFLFTAQSSQRRSMLSVFINSRGVLSLQTRPKLAGEFDRFIFKPRRWYHIGLTHHRHRFTSGSDAVLYVDGVARQTLSSLPWVPPAPSGAAVSVYFGPPPERRGTPSKLRWRLGAFFLTEEMLQAQAMFTLNNLGPGYTGSFQGILKPYQTYENINSRALYDLPTGTTASLDLGSVAMPIHLERLVLGFSAVCTQASAEDSFLLLRNTATIGLDQGLPPAALLVGGARLHVPRSLASEVRDLGSPFPMFALIAAARSSAELASAVRLTCSIITRSSQHYSDLPRTHGYEITAGLLRRHAGLLDEHVIRQLAILVGYDVNEPARSVIANYWAFKYFLLDYDVWRDASPAMQLCLLQYLSHFIIDNLHAAFNLRRLRRLHFTLNMLSVLYDSAVSPEAREFGIKLLRHTLSRHYTHEDLNHVGRFVLSTLPVLRAPDPSSPSAASPRRSAPRAGPGAAELYRREIEETRAVTWRNSMLQMLIDTLGNCEADAWPAAQLTDFVRTCNTGWLLCFINASLHPSTVLCALRLLTTLLHVSSEFASTFRSVGGFDILAHQLPDLADVPDVYFLLLCMMLGRPVPRTEHVSLDFFALAGVFKNHYDTVQVQDALQVLFHLMLHSRSRATAHSLETSSSSQSPRAVPPAQTPPPPQLQLQRAVPGMSPQLPAPAATPARTAAMAKYRRQTMDARVVPVFPRIPGLDVSDDDGDGDGDDAAESRAVSNDGRRRDAAGETAEASSGIDAGTAGSKNDPQDDVLFVPSTTRRRGVSDTSLLAPSGSKHRPTRSMSSLSPVREHGAPTDATASSSPTAGDIASGTGRRRSPSPSPVPSPSPAPSAADVAAVPTSPTVPILQYWIHLFVKSREFHPLCRRAPFVQAIMRLLFVQRNWTMSTAEPEDLLTVWVDESAASPATATAPEAAGAPAGVRRFGGASPIRSARPDVSQPPGIVVRDLLDSLEASGATSAADAAAGEVPSPTVSPSTAPGVGDDAQASARWRGRSLFSSIRGSRATIDASSSVPDVAATLTQTSAALDASSGSAAGRSSSSSMLGTRSRPALARLRRSYQSDVSGIPLPDHPLERPDDLRAELLGHTASSSSISAAGLSTTALPVLSHVPSNSGTVSTDNTASASASASASTSAPTSAAASPRGSSTPAGDELSPTGLQIPRPRNRPRSTSLGHLPYDLTHLVQQPSSPPGVAARAFAPVSGEDGSGGGGDGTAPVSGNTVAGARAPESSYAATDSAAAAAPSSHEYVFHGDEAETIFELLGLVVMASFRGPRGIDLLQVVLEMVPPSAPPALCAAAVRRVLYDACWNLTGQVTCDKLKGNARLSSNAARFAGILVDKCEEGWLPYGDPIVHEYLLTMFRLSDGVRALARDHAQYLRAYHRFVLHALSMHAPRNATVMQRRVLATRLHEVLQGMIDDHHVLVRACEASDAFVTGLCHRLHRYMLHDSTTIREDCMNIWRLLLLRASVAMRSLLVPAEPGIDDDKTVFKGFQLLLQADHFIGFSHWLGSNDDLVCRVLDHTSSRAYVQHTVTAGRQRQERAMALRDARIERSKALARREAGIRRRQGRLDAERRQVVVKIRDNVNNRIRKRREVASEKAAYWDGLWSQALETLVRETGTLGCDLARSESPILQRVAQPVQLDLTEGPFRMRKKLIAHTSFHRLYPDPSALHIDAEVDEERRQQLRASVEEEQRQQRAIAEEEEKRRQADAQQLSQQQQGSDDGGEGCAAPQSHDQDVASADTAAVDADGVEEVVLPAALVVPPRPTIDLPPEPATPLADETDSPPASASALPVPQDMLPAPRLDAESPPPTHAAALTDAMTTDVGSVDDGDDSDDVDDNELIVTDADAADAPASDAAPVAAGRTKQQSEAASDGSSGADGEDGADSGSGGDDSGNDSIDGGDDGSTDRREEDARVARMLDPRDSISMRLNAYRVAGLDKHACVFLLCTHHIYIVDNYRINDLGELVEVEDDPEEDGDDFDWVHIDAAVGGASEPGGIAKGKASGQQFKHKCRRWAYRNVLEIHKRSFLLSPVALEFFFTDGCNYLLVFAKGTRDDLHAKLLTHDLPPSAFVAPHETVTTGSGTVGAEDAAPGGALRRLTKIDLWGANSMMSKWVRGQISNFQYLMYLNTMAGRTYNDLTQYPVFPWVLADYTSDDLDLNDPGVFRDLTKPMGAMTDWRAEQARERYEILSMDQHGDGPFHYGTHYMSAGVVLHYLLRVEPFTRHSLTLQGGHFDHPDRLFHSVADTWRSASTMHVGDVKELIPEFFYMPEFLVNSNGFGFGRKQVSGDQVGDVLLPPWARGSPHRFIRLHRQALESEHVSKHLHHWIDLIFGFRQQGAGAVEALNVFHPFSYEGCVDDIDSVTDPVQRKAKLAHINNFGQTPKQLFKKPHPVREKPSAPFLFTHPELLVPDEQRGVTAPEDIASGDSSSAASTGAGAAGSAAAGTATGGDTHITGDAAHYAVGSMQLLHDRLHVFEASRMGIPPRFQDIASWGHVDGAVRVARADTERLETVFERMHLRVSNLVSSDDGSIWVSAGENECVLRVWRHHPPSRSHARHIELLATLVGHHSPIAALAVSQAYSLILSGAENGTIIVWDLNTLRFVRQLIPVPKAFPSTSGCSAPSVHRRHLPIAAVCINHLTGDLAAAVGTWLFLWTVNGAPLACVDARCRGALLLPARTATIRSITFSSRFEWSDLSILATGHQDGSIVLWQHAPLPRHSVSATTSSGGAGGAGGGGTDVGPAAPTHMHGSPAAAAAAAGSGGAASPLFAGRAAALDPLMPPLPMPMGSDMRSSMSPRGSVGPSTALSSSFSPSLPSGATASIDSLATAGAGALTPSGAAATTTSTTGPSTSTATPATGGSAASAAYQLRVRHVLSEHTAPVTCVYIDRESKRLYSGDALGRVLCWTLRDGGDVAHWVRDADVTECSVCRRSFGFVERRHHCRNCGRYVCAGCSEKRIPLPERHFLKPVRVCDQCAAEVQAGSAGRTTAAAVLQPPPAAASR